MRKYVDLHLIPNANKYESMLRNAVELGFGMAGVVGPKPRDSDIDAASRLDLSPKNQNQLSSQLGNSRRKYEIISVTCLSKSVARQAAKDSRVDIIKFPLGNEKNRGPRLDHHQANLMKDTDCCYEIDITDLMSHDGYMMESRLRRLSKEVRVASRADIPMVASSGAHEAIEMRTPQAIASMLNLIGLEENEALDMVSKNPVSIVMENRAKLSKSYIMPGVWLNESPP